MASTPTGNTTGCADGNLCGTKAAKVYCQRCFEDISEVPGFVGKRGTTATEDLLRSLRIATNPFPSPLNRSFNNGYNDGIDKCITALKITGIIPRSTKESLDGK